MRISDWSSDVCSSDLVGSSEVKAVDVRVISATHQDLGAAIADGKFREDLFFRLGVVVLQVPSLASRVEDIPALVRHFQDRKSVVLGKSVSVRVDLGGLRIIKQKKTQTIHLANK